MTAPLLSQQPAPAPAVVTPPAVRPAVDAHTARLARLARVWGEVKFRHPYIWEGRGIDWDAALAAALPAVDRASSDDEEATAVDAMLAALQDPISRVEPAVPAVPASAAGAPVAPLSTSWIRPGTLLVTLAPRTWQESEKVARELKGPLATAKTVVLDLRTASTSEVDTWLVSKTVSDLAPSIVAHDCASPAARELVHSGYTSQRGSGGPYFTGSLTRAPLHFEASAGPHPRQVIALVSERTTLPDVILAMQSAGDARIVAQGPLNEPARSTRAEVAVSAQKRAFVRTMEPETPLRADLTVPTDGDALPVALKLAEQPPRHRAVRAPSPSPTIRWRPDATYPDEAYPPRAHRLLALFRFWNVIRLFYPDLHLIGPAEWDEVLTDFIPRFDAAKDAREYALAVAELVTRIHDSHGYVDSAELNRFFGWSIPSITVRDVEGRPVVLKMRDEARASGIRIGDEILAIDGVPFATRAARVRPYLAASNDWALARNVDSVVTGGAKDSVAVLQVRGGEGRQREVRLPRARLPPAPSPAPHYRLLEGGSVGYVDMGELMSAEVPAMFASFARTRSIVFDMRGYPNGTAWTITPYLNVRKASTGPELWVNLVGFEDTQRVMTQSLPPTVPGTALYTGKTVMLIDESTQSQAEHTGLFFEAASGTTFIGSPSAGANGNVTEVGLPGNIYVSFSGMEVRHADGRPLQRVGLQPEVTVRPTLAGLRAGRDEVLERALAYLRDGR